MVRYISKYEQIEKCSISITMTLIHSPYTHTHNGRNTIHLCLDKRILDVCRCSSLLLCTLQTTRLKQKKVNSSAVRCRYLQMRAESLASTQISEKTSNIRMEIVTFAVGWLNKFTVNATNALVAAHRILMATLPLLSYPVCHQAHHSYAGFSAQP